MKKPTNKKLSLATQTVRPLDNTALQSVQGGVLAYYWTVNYTNCNCYFNANAPGTASMGTGGCVQPVTTSVINPAYQP